MEVTAKFLEMLLATSGTLIATGNRLPFIWHSVLSNLLSLLLSLSLLRFTQLGPGALVAGPMLAGCIFNYWYWPAYAARSIQTAASPCDRLRARPDSRLSAFPKLARVSLLP